MTRKILLRWLINSVALYVAIEMVPGIHAVGDWRTIVIVAAIFGLVNALIRPIIKLLTCPLLILTLGLFTLVINALMLGLTGWLAAQFNMGFHIDSFLDAFWGALVISFVSLAITLLIGEGKNENSLRKI